MMRLAPRGKTIVIGSEQVEVYPRHCTDSHKCIRCYFTGKYPCAPRWWLYPPVYLAPLPTKRSWSKPWVSLDIPTGEGNTLADDIPAQPLIPFNDGGFTEEITNAVMSRSIFKRYSPCRDTDQPCLKCDYPYLRYAGFRKSRNKNYYKCPQCGKHQIQDSERKPEIIKPFLRELWMQGVIKKEIIIRIQSRYGIKVSKATLDRKVKSMRLAPRKGWGRHSVVARLGPLAQPSVFPPRSPGVPLPASGLHSKG